jgi:hypothetical protein
MRVVGGSLMRVAATLAALAVTFAAQPASARASDDQVKQKIVKESIGSYPGNCPCPYNIDRAGRSCGGRSAYSRPGGYAPKCYASDVSASDVREYRQSH